MKICIDCGNTLKGRQRKYCSRQCMGRVREQKPERKAYVQGYKQRPEIKERERKRSQIPENKVRAKELSQRPEKKAKKREYEQKPEIKEKRRERERKRYQIPEVRARKRESARKSNQKPEVRARKRKYLRKYTNKRMKNDLGFKILRNYGTRTRNALSRALNGIPIKKYTSTQKLLGCSIQEFMKHIENQFEEGMSWENWTIDGWHIDHIKPCFRFDLTKPEEQKECFHYTNQRPLWAKENMSRTYEELQTITR